MGDKISVTEQIFAGKGEMAALIRTTDWSKTPLGSIESWPQSLRTAVSICLGSRHPIVLWWGPDRWMFYNDGYRPMLGESKHPQFLGQPGQACWAEIWSVVGPMMDQVIETGEATWSEDLFLLMVRYGYLEETYFTFSYSPIRDEKGRPSGIFCALTESTRRVLGERRVKTLRELTGEARTVNEAAQFCAETLGHNARDMPFTLVYLLDNAGERLHLAGHAGLAPGTEASPVIVDMTGPDEAGWPLARVATHRRSETVEGLADRFDCLPKAPWDEPAHQAMLLPIARPGSPQPAGVLVLGISCRRAFDEDYRGFFDLVAGHVATAVSNARAHTEQRERAEMLAELDRAKTAFFSNVSHEFRTPLTLMMGPLEEALAGHHGALSGALAEALALTHRNSQRLLKLVTTLLDFTRLESGRVNAVFAPTDLATYTAELASAFQSAMDSADLQFRIACDDLGEPTYVDREMWEKIVLNLVSNAFKFTLQGGVTVTLGHDGERVRLDVTDTGAGIPANELPRVFERFHRIEGQRARTYEGSGIGLALVHELVKMHGGEIRIESEPGKGSTFTVLLPRGDTHLPSDRIAAAVPEPGGSPSGSGFVEEAIGWLPRSDAVESAPPVETPVAGSVRPRIVLVDDNNDMREYVTRLLRRHWRVEALADGAAALEAAQREPPDLVLTDVMMPGLGGFGLLRALRADARTRHVPIIMLSARAGEEARVEGLEAGADDYVIKPFSARELIARVRANLELAHARLAAASADAANRHKDEFLALLGHELSNPLAPIFTAVQLMKLRGDGGNDREREVIDRQTRHMSRLVENLLDIARATRGLLRVRTEPVEIASATARAIEMASPALEQRQHKLSVDIPCQGLVVDGDQTRLAQVFANLLTNAAKFTDRGGCVGISAKREGDRIRVSVRDDGHGIASDMVERIFEPFIQAERPHDLAMAGLGLGLPLVQNLVELHGGTVKAVSAGMGRGSEFIVELPALPLAIVTDIPRARSSTPVVGAGGKRVLVVDDNRDAADMFSQALAFLGHEVATAYNGPDGLALADSLRPHVAILDIGLPSMDGYEVARRLRESFGTSLRIIAVTGYGEESDRDQSRRAGFDVHLVKPVDIDVLARALTEEGRDVIAS